MLNNIWKGPYILFMYFFVVFLMIFLYALIKLKRNLLLSPHPKIHPHPHVPEIFSFSKENMEARKKMKTAHENGPLKTGHRKFNPEARKRMETAHLKTNIWPAQEVDVGFAGSQIWKRAAGSSIPDMELCMSANRPDGSIPCG